MVQKSVVGARNYILDIFELFEDYIEIGLIRFNSS